MTITTYTDREIKLQKELALEKQLAQLNGEIAAELKEDKLMLEAERDTLRQQLAEAQAVIEASLKQEAVAWKVNVDIQNYQGQSEFRTILAFRPDPVIAAGNYEINKVISAQPLYAAPVVADDVLKDALKKIADAAFKHSLSLVKTADGFDLLRRGTATAGMGGAA